MAHYIENMEASDWKECVAVWKNDKHREEVLAKQEDIRKLTEQTARSAAIAANAAVVTAQNSAVTAQVSITAAKNTEIAAKGAYVTALNTARTKKDLKNVLDYFSK